jgi:hypothetical protein
MITNAVHSAGMAPVANTMSLGVIVGAFLGILPTVAVILAILWYMLEIYESKTVQKRLRLSRRRRSLRIAKIAARTAAGKVHIPDNVK